MKGVKETLKMYNLGNLPHFDSMLVFHALAYLGLEGFILVSPQEPIVTLGYFQDARTGIDLDYCRRNNLGVMRREVGGGTTLLDKNQVFYQIVLRKNSPYLPQNMNQVYRQFSHPVIDAYRDWGVKVRFKEVNDLITEEGGRKITGEGGADIGQCVVFVGGILMDFDYETMSRVFPAQNEEYRAQLLQSLQKNITSINKELGVIPCRNVIEERLQHHFARIFGSFESAELTDEIWAKARELEKLYVSETFVAKQTRGQKGIKIASGVDIFENRHKAVGGTIHVIFEANGKRLGQVNLCGDFTFSPKEKLGDLEQVLHGLMLEKEQVLEAIRVFFSSQQVDCPGVTPEDFTQAILGGFVQGKKMF